MHILTLLQNDCKLAASFNVTYCNNGCPYDACNLRQSEPTPCCSEWCLQMNKKNENSYLFLIHILPLLSTNKVVFHIHVIVKPYKIWSLLEIMNLNLFIVQRSNIYSDCYNKAFHSKINMK